MAFIRQFTLLQLFSFVSSVGTPGRKDSAERIGKKFGKSANRLSLIGFFRVASICPCASMGRSALT